MKAKVLILIITISTLFTAVPVQAASKNKKTESQSDKYYIVEDDENEEFEEEPEKESVDSEEDYSEEDVVELEEPMGSKYDKSNKYKTIDMDEMGEFIVDSASSEFNNCQLNFSCEIPTGFTLGTVLEVENVTEELKFQLIATSSNNYVTRMFVPAGDYRIINCYVDGDTAMEYPMDFPEGFSLEKTTIFTVESTLSNYEEVEEEANKRMHPELYAEKKVETASEPATNTNQEIDKIPTWRRIRHEGEGSGIISIPNDDVCKFPINVIFEITKTGGEKKGEYRYSTDGGETWSDVFVIKNNVEKPILSTKTGNETGLTFKMRGTNGFVKMDKYYFDSQVEYEVSPFANSGNALIKVYSDEPIYEKSYKIQVKIKSTGHLGEGVFIYSLNDGKTWSDEIIIPKDGNYEVEGTQIKFTFWDSDTGFLVSDGYECEIKGDYSQRDYTPYIIAGVMLFFFVVFGVFYNFRRQKRKPSDYQINEYKPVELKKRR